MKRAKAWLEKHYAINKGIRRWCIICGKKFPNEGRKYDVCGECKAMIKLKKMVMKLDLIKKRQIVVTLTLDDVEKLDELKKKFMGNRSRAISYLINK